jgi:hypothetical protein
MRRAIASDHIEGKIQAILAIRAPVVGAGDPGTSLRLRRLRRSRRLTQIRYWTPWAIGALVFLLLLAGGVVGFAAGS